jgi:hypothetical protein
LTLNHKSEIIEVSLLGDAVLITFADEMVALVEADKIRRFAEEINAVKPAPKGPPLP